MVNGAAECALVSVFYLNCLFLFYGGFSLAPPDLADIKVASYDMSVFIDFFKSGTVIYLSAD
jgi:hypothetical protein